MAKDGFMDMALGVSKAELDGQIVSKTLDTLNSSMYSPSKKAGGQDMSDMYDLNKSVLSAYYLGKGTAVEEDC